MVDDSGRKMVYSALMKVIAARSVIIFDVNDVLISFHCDLILITKRAGFYSGHF